jgi:hypothetical protein
LTLDTNQKRKEAGAGNEMATTATAATPNLITSTSMTTNPPEAKRPRLSINRSDSGSHSNSAASSHPHPVVSVSPDTASSSQLPPVNLVFTDDTPPTSDNIESALHKIGDTKNHYTKHEILQALKDLERWANDDNDRRVFCTEFLELGGTSRILKFLMVPTNISDMEYVSIFSCIIMGFTYPGQNGENIDIALVMAKKFVERGGVHTMLLANEKYTGGNDDKKLRAVSSIWAVLENIGYHRVAFDELEKDKRLNLFDDALATLRLLNGANNETYVPLIKRQILNFLANLIHHDSKLVAGDYKGRGVFQTCIDAMKDTNRQWDFNENVWSTASKFFVHCFVQKLFSTENNDELKLVLSFYVEFIKKAPNKALKENAFGFLHNAVDVIGKEEMAKTPGLMSTLGVILDPSTNDTIEKDTKHMAKSLAKLLF